MDRFSKLNPKVSFLFFVLIIALTLVLFNPFYLLITLVASFCYNIKLQGKRAVKTFFTFLVPITLLTGAFNMFFVNWGDTVLFTSFYKEFTLEALFYGLCQGVMFSSMIMWISNYSIVLTSDKFLSVFSNLAPNITLVFSMVLSFLPRMRKNAQEINEARMNIDTEKSQFKKSIDNFSALVSMTLEESLEVSDSMESRGFNNKRTSYTKYRFGIKDGLIIVVSICLFAIVMYFKIIGKTIFIYEPTIKINDFSLVSIIVFAVLSFLPLIIDLEEDIRWLLLKQKI